MIGYKNVYFTKIDKHNIEIYIYYNAYTDKKECVIYWQFKGNYLSQTLYYDINADRLTYTDYNITKRQRELLINKLIKIYKIEGML